MNAQKQLAENFAEAHPADAALVLERLAPPVAAAYLDALAPRLAAAVLQHMASANGAECLARLAPARGGAVVGLMPLDRRALLLRRLEGGRRELILGQLPAPARALLERLLGYPENSAAALMDPLVLALPADLSAGEALTRLRRTPRRALYYLYIVDRAQKLAGVINLRELMLAAPKDLLSTIMRRDVIHLAALTDRAAIVEHPGWRQVHALPVVDAEGLFLGALRYETLKRLEDENKAPAGTAGALAAMLTLGELWWLGLAGVLTDLTTPARAQGAAVELGEEPTHG